MFKGLQILKPPSLMFALFVAVSFSVYPGRTALEGDQRNVERISDQSDNWGFITSFLYSNWPDSFVPWRYSLIVLQVSLTFAGFTLLFRKISLKNKFILFCFFLVYFLSLMFSAQLWRDSSLFAITIFAFGLLAFATELQGWRKYSTNLFSILLTVIASMFKPVFALTLIPLFLWLIWQLRREKPGFRYRGILVVVIPLILGILPFSVDTYLKSRFEMQKTFPEQQPMILDLSMNYCWGRSESIRVMAESTLRDLVQEGYPLESICAATNPLRWDELYADTKVWRYSSPISKISGNRDAEARLLLKGWVSMILNNPFDWFQVRLLVLGPALFASNSFVDYAPEFGVHSPVSRATDFIWPLLHNAVGILDKARLTSPFFLHLIILCIFLFSFSKSEEQKLFIWKNLAFSLGTLFFLLPISVVTWLAPNGRYVMPYLLLSYALLLRSLKREFKNSHIQSDISESQ